MIFQLSLNCKDFCLESTNFTHFTPLIKLCKLHYLIILLINFEDFEKFKKNWLRGTNLYPAKKIFTITQKFSLSNR